MRPCTSMSLRLRVAAGLVLAAAALPQASAQDSFAELASVVDDPVAVGVEPTGFAFDCTVLDDGSTLFVSNAFNLVPDDRNRSPDLFVRAPGGAMTRLTGAGGAEFASGVGDYAVSADGAWIAVLTGAALVADDDNGHEDLYLIERATAAARLVNRTPAGAVSVSPPRAPVISADGRYVAFAYFGNGLMPSLPDVPQYDIYRYDRDTGTIVLVSARDAALGAGFGNGNSDTTQRISADGNLVAFTSRASDLIAADGNGLPDVFVRDVAAGTTRRVSTTVSGGEIAAASYLQDISGDGTIVLFGTDAGLAASDGNGRFDLYRKRLADGAQSWVTRTSTGAAYTDGTGPYDGRLSADGTVIVFVSNSGQLLPGDALGYEDVFVRTPAGLQRISAPATGNANNASWTPCLSADGTRAGYESLATNLVASDLNAERDVFVCTLASCLPERASAAAVAVPVDAAAYGADSLPVAVRGGDSPPITPSIARDGSSVLFASTSFNLDLDDADGRSSVDLYVRDRALGRTTLVTPGDLQAGAAAAMSGNARFVVVGADIGIPAGVEQLLLIDRQSAGPPSLLTAVSPGIGWNADSASPHVDDDGEWIVFDSAEPATGVVDTNGVSDVYRYRRSTGAIDVVSLRPSGNATANGASTRASISDDGRYVAFESLATSLVPGLPVDANGVADVFLRDTVIGKTTRLSRNPAGESDGVSGVPKISADGSCVAFASRATDLAAGDTNGDGSDVFVHDRASGGLTLVSRRPDGSAAGTDDWFTAPAVSVDCRYVVYFATLRDIVAPGTTLPDDYALLLRFDRTTGATVVINRAPDGSWTSDKRLAGASVTGDGATIAASGEAPHEPHVDVNAYTDAYTFELVFDAVFASGFE
jgi:Tol biopolymer transport system component